MITVDSSIAVPCNLDRLTISVTVAGEPQSRALDLAPDDLPGSLSITATDLNTETASIEVTGLLGAEVVAVGRGDVDFEPGASKEVAFALDEACTADAPCPPVVSPRFDGLPPSVARRACVDRYSVAPTLLGILNACDLAQDIQASTLQGANEVEVESPLDPEMPFPFYLYNHLATDLWIGDNGYVTVGAEPPMATVGEIGPPRSLGEPGFPGPGVVPFWDQLITGDKGVCLAVTGAAPHRILWISWDQVCFEGAGTCGDLSFGSLTFSVAFEETSNKIYIGYPEMVGTGPAEARARGLTAAIGVVADESLGKGCPASECSDQGLCDSGEPCNYTEFSSLTDTELTGLELTPR